MHGKKRVATAYDDDEVIFESSYGLLDYVLLIKIWRDRLVRDDVLLEVLFDELGSFVVNYLNGWFQSPCC